jgi:adenine/guanine phosphoribosyltransferase-like PRPP-binding protein
VGEPVDRERIAMHEALATAIVGAVAPADDSPGETLYLSFEKLSTDPAAIRTLLRPDRELPNSAVLIVDLALPPYALLAEPLLANLAQAVVELVEGSDRTALLLLERMPPDISLLWFGLSRLGERGRIHVADTSGNVRAFGATASPQLMAVVRKEGARLASPVQQRFERKLLRSLGHFRARDRAGRSRCARFHYDCSLALDELSELLVTWVRRRATTKQARAAATLVLCGVESGWMVDAAMVAAGRAGTRLVRIPARPRKKDLHAIPPGGKTLLVFDVVSSGATLDAAVRALSKAGIAAQPRAFAALAASRQVLQSGPVTVDAQHIASRELVEPEACPQCRAGMRHTPPARPGQLRISAFDMWTVLLDVPWAAETYGPGGLPRFDYLPEFGEVFRSYGDWIAFRYELLLRELGQTSDVVVVCPDEPAVRELVAKLRLRFDDRLVAVAVNRGLINDIAARSVKPADVKRETHRQDARDWQVQLRMLQESQSPVVVLDEFAASGATAEAIIDLLRAFKISVSAYLPFVDFNTRLDLRGGVPVHPLYQLPSPRP